MTAVAGAAFKAMQDSVAIGVVIQLKDCATAVRSAGISRAVQFVVTRLEHRIRLRSVSTSKAESMQHCVIVAILVEPEEGAVSATTALRCAVQRTVTSFHQACVRRCSISTTSGECMDYRVAASIFAELEDGAGCGVAAKLVADKPIRRPVKRAVTSFGQARPRVFVTELMQFHIIAAILVKLERRTTR